MLKYGIGLGLLAYVIASNWEPKGNSPGLKEIGNRAVNPRDSVGFRR